MAFGSGNAVSIAFQGKDEVSPVVRGIRTSMEGFKRDAATGFGLGAGISVFNMAKNAIGGVVDFLGDATRAAMVEEESISRLTAAIQANDAGWSGNIDAIEAVINERKDLAFADDEQRTSLARLVSVTKDSTEALELQRTAMDLARLRGMDLATASDLLGKVYGGNIGILSRYGIQLEKGTTATEALAEIQKRATGQAEAYANTTQGKLARAQIRAEDAMEELGAAILPVVGDLASLAADVIPAVSDALNNMRRFLDPKNARIEDLDDAIRELAADMELPGEVIVDWVRKQRELRDSTEALDEEIRGMGASSEGAADFIAGLTKVSSKYGIELRVLQDEVAEVADLNEGLLASISDPDDRWAQLNRVLNEALENLGLVGGEMTATAGTSDDLRTEALALIESFSDLSDEEKLALQTTLGLGDGLQTAADEGVVVMDKATDSLIQSMKDLPPSMHKAIVDGKESVREAMTELRWAMEHPFAEEKYANWLEARADKANEKLTKALQRGQVDAAREAAALRAAIYAELSGLNDQTYHLKVEVEYDPLSSIGNTGGGKRAAGGPVSAGSTYLVGERGPELLTMGGNGYVTPNHAIGGGGGDVYLDGYLVGRVIDERLGRQYGTASRAGYRRAA